jgi:hypothetical protein
MTADLHEPSDVHAGMAWHHQLSCALDGYAAAVVAALAARGIHARHDLAAGVDMAWIDLTIPALAATVHDATVCYTDDLGWHHQTAAAGPGSGEMGWARLVPVTAATTAADLTPAPDTVADVLAALAAGARWPVARLDELTVVEDLADRWLDGLIGVLEARCPASA